ncbi:MAG: hypothetical protein ACYCY6_01345 [Minisyncoccota bacterium]
MKINFFKKDSYESRGSFLGWGSGPDADWNVIFKTFLVMLITVFVLSVLMFVKVGTGKFGSDLDSTTTTPIDAITLKHLAIDYKDLLATFNELKTATESVPDPSI